MTQETLRDEVSGAIASAVDDIPGGKWLLRSHRLMIADRILAIPRLQEALRLLEREHEMMRDLVNHSVHITKGGERIEPSDFYKPPEDSPISSDTGGIE